jgi:hypothetical protein
MRQATGGVFEQWKVLNVNVSEFPWSVGNTVLTVPQNHVFSATSGAIFFPSDYSQPAGDRVDNGYNGPCNTGLSTNQWAIYTNPAISTPAKLESVFDPSDPKVLTCPLFPNNCLVAFSRNISFFVPNYLTCAISNLSIAHSFPCDPITNTYDLLVRVEYSNEPLTGTLDVNGQSFAITTSPQDCLLTGLPADGLPLNVTAEFSANTECTLTVPSLFTAPVCECCPKKYQVFDGTNWVDPCDCDVNIMGSSNTWQLLDPANCPTSFWDGTKWVLIECCPSQEITDNTEINIWFDNSGSMNDTLPPLDAMIAPGGALRDCLISFYNNDFTLFNERVKVLDFNNDPTNTERFIPLLATERNFDRTPDTSVNKVINITFADESDIYGYGSGPDLFYLAPFDNTQLNGGVAAGNPYEDTYIDDVTAVRAVQNDPSISYDIEGIAFHVASIYDEPGCTYPRPDNVAPCATCTISATPSLCYGNNGTPTWPSFGDLVESTFVDNGVYSGISNLSDLYSTKYVYERDLLEGSTQVYYANRVIAKLNELGISLPC